MQQLSWLVAWKVFNFYQTQRYYRSKQSRRENQNYFLLHNFILMMSNPVHHLQKAIHELNRMAEKYPRQPNLKVTGIEPVRSKIAIQNKETKELDQYGFLDCHNWDRNRRTS